jgi:hypothetical protein
MSLTAGSYNEGRSRGNAVTLATTAQRGGCRVSPVKHDSLSIDGEQLVTNRSHYLYVAGPGYCSALVSLYLDAKLLTHWQPLGKYVY